ncbi:MAG: hypothetical protein QOJ26_340 [Thermoplasmata archaeon]|nr:hypothetical protein [Thermoplasmata archaeon]
MNALAKALSMTAALGALLLAVPGLAVSQSPPTTAPSSTVPLSFGMDANAVSAETAAGVRPDYGTFWIGPWTLGSGWGGPDAQMTAMKNAGVTPAIHHYYWGDDISQSCLENGCYSTLHKADKNKEGWQLLTDQLIAHLNSKMGGKPVLIFLETEFNKGNVATYEPLDGYLAEKAAQIKAGYPNAKIVMSLGNWNSAAWSTWDRTAAASDYTGIQGMRGSTRQDATGYATLYEKTLEGATLLKSKFGKPVVLQDIALSTYPEPDYLKRQADELRDFFSHSADLKAQGVQALLYRSWRDSPTMDTANYYGEAERHWGLVWAGNATQKAGGQVWIDGVKAERAGSATPSPTPTPTPPPNRAPTASFVASVSALTVAVDGSGSSDPDGQAITYAWTFGDGATAIGATVSHMYGAAGTYTVTLSVSDGSLASTASQGVSVVKPNQAPTAGFTASASNLAAAFDASASSDPDGTPLSYAWTFGDGATASGRTASRTYVAAGTYTVKLTVSDGQATAAASKTVTVAAAATSSSSTSSAPPTPGYAASFTFGPGANEYWVEAKVSASPAPAKVEVKVGSGAWSPLRQRDAITWGEGMHVVKGTPVAFRATAADGRVATTASQAYLSTGTMTGTSSPSATPTPSPAPTTSTSGTAFKAYFTPRSVGNDWWIEAATTANQPIAKVEAKVGSGAWTVLPPTDWGTYAKSINAPNGSQVTFRATTSGGATSLSAATTWT